MPSPGPSETAQAVPAGLAAEEFEAFYRANYQAALSFARCRASDADCEALVADAFLVTWLHFQVAGELNRGWFYGVLRNKIGDFYRSARRREVLVEVPDAEHAAEDPTSGADLHIDVMQALQTLPASYSEPLILAYWCDLSGAEAARVLGISSGALRVRLHRAQRAFLRVFGSRTGREVTRAEVNRWTAQRT